MANPFVYLLVMVLVSAIALLLFWPKGGLVGQWQRARQVTERSLCEDALKHIYKWEAAGHQPSLQSIAGTLQLTVDDAAGLLSKMEAKGLLRWAGSEFGLTPAGRDYALHIIRTHRLWERYLSDETGFAETEWHAQAERYEHTLSPGQAAALSAQLGHPTHDPHGDPIPTAAGEVIVQQGQPLTALAVGRTGRIVHLEDEPETIYAQLVAEGLYPGLELPPYRPPRILQTIYISLIDRTLFVLWRAVVFALPAGAVIWLSANIYLGPLSLAEYMIDFLDPFGLLLGLNGVILVAYLVAIPANEIVIPTVLMLTVLTTGMAGVGRGAGVMFELESQAGTLAIFSAGGWTMLTAVNLMLFSLIHNPCSTTLYTIYKETGSVRWTVVSALLPLLMGFGLTFVVAQLWPPYGAS